ncbi:MAG: phosphoribosyl-AMP cyclohydrolase [Chloroflexia bacterium]|nr:phosphoribosyl-AMP cyclohydrolase [Chloroflexia bacterium]
MNGTPLPVAFGPDGLVPAVITDIASGDVLMIGFMNEEALQHTRDTGYVHFWSRSRQALWKKGETSGHVQEVQQISINCERNSLLIEVRQVGAVCHDGYPTCFYRRLEPDNTLTTVRDRWFDPADVYGKSGSGLATSTRRWWGAYESLRDNDWESTSGTSRLLRDRDDRVTTRLAEELRELAGALDGTHRHVDPASDVALEGGQVCYWLALRCIRDGLTWMQVRPDRALDAPASLGERAASSLAGLIRREAEFWLAGSNLDVAALAHGSLAMVAAACGVVGVTPRSLIMADLNEMRTRAYLEPYFAEVDGK